MTPTRKLCLGGLTAAFVALPCPVTAQGQTAVPGPPATRLSSPGTMPSAPADVQLPVWAMGLGDEPTVDPVRLEQFAAALNQATAPGSVFKTVPNGMSPAGQGFRDPGSGKRRRGRGWGEGGRRAKGAPTGAGDLLREEGRRKPQSSGETPAGASGSESASPELEIDPNATVQVENGTYAINKTPSDTPHPTFPLLVYRGPRPEGPSIYRTWPGLIKVLDSLEGGRMHEARARFEELHRQMERCEATTKLEPGKQAAATKYAYNLSRNKCDNATLKEAVSNAAKCSTPLLLDLDGNGRPDVTSPDVRGLAGAFRPEGATWFDVSGGGLGRRTEWLVAGRDGLLVHDGNGNGLVDSALELFGEAEGFADGFAKLSIHDLNGDGMLTGRELAGLSVWVDDGDGMSEAGELMELADLGITDIHVRPREDRSSFTRNGRRYTLWDWSPRME